MCIFHYLKRGRKKYHVKKMDIFTHIRLNLNSLTDFDRDFLSHLIHRLQWNVEETPEIFSRHSRRTILHCIRLLRDLDSTLDYSELMRNLQDDLETNNNKSLPVSDQQSILEVLSHLSSRLLNDS